MATPTLEAIKYARETGLQLLDQLKLPFEFEYIEISSTDEGWAAIREMKVRGAPAIAIAAALSLSVEAKKKLGSFESVTAASEWLIERLAYLRTSRPTAVNLFNECDKLEAFVGALGGVRTSDEVLQAYIEKAEMMLESDIKDNQAIGAFGADAIATGEAKVKVLTHCNTGSLATARYGTALGVIRALHERGKLEHAFCTETRPYNQGCRLTAFELVFEQIPATLVCDSMASSLMAVKGLDAVVVGADRTVANGDTANKIGTYQLAIAAQYHGVAFDVAVPFSSLDCKMKTGTEIEIEERQGEELTSVNGTRIAAEGIGVWNPAFDVTPARLITGLITEYGIITKAEGASVFDVPAFVALHTKSS